MPNNNVRGNSSHISSTSNQSAATSIQAQRVVTPEEVNGPNNSSMGAHDSSSQADQETLHEVVEDEQDVSQELNNLFNPQANSTSSEEGDSSNWQNPLILQLKDMQREKRSSSFLKLLTYY